MRIICWISCDLILMLSNMLAALLIASKRLSSIVAKNIDSAINVYKKSLSLLSFLFMAFVVLLLLLLLYSTNTIDCILSVFCFTSTYFQLFMYT